LLSSFFSQTNSPLTSGENALTTFEFYVDKIATASAWPAARSHFRREEPGGSAMRVVNSRCVPSINFGALELQYFDGASK
jgi:hypothetical protein